LITRRCLAIPGALVALAMGISASPSAAGAIPNFSWLTNSDGPVQLYRGGVPTTWRSTWAIMNTGACNKLPAGAVPAYWFGDYSVFANAVSDGEIAGPKATLNGCEFAYQAVVVDYENWSFTPLIQRQQWKTYVQEAYTLAHSHGLKVIQAMTHGVPGTADSQCPGWAGYFSCDGVSAPAYEAQYADVVDIQAQQEEADLDGQPGSFNYEVNTGATQAKAANPHVLVLAGMRSSAQAVDGSCTQIPPTTLESDWNAVSANVNGAWLNVNCDPSAFAPLLEQLYR
jgi:hypothetical protein